MAGFIKMQRSHFTIELLKHDAEFRLLAFIALRVDRNTGEAFIGKDDVLYHLRMSEQRYRTAKANLQKWGWVTTKGTNKGTVIKIINSDIFDVNLENSNAQDVEQPTRHQHASNAQNPPNKKKEVKEKRREKEITCPHVEIIDAYHTILPMLPRVKNWGDASRSNLRARWREDAKRQSVDWWCQFFAESILSSDFLTGKSNLDWRANLTWIVKPKNFEKILNGAYENRAPALSGSARSDQNFKVCQEFINGE